MGKRFSSVIFLRGSCTTTRSTMGKLISNVVGMFLLIMYMLFLDTCGKSANSLKCVNHARFDRRLSLYTLCAVGKKIQLASVKYSY